MAEINGIIRELWQTTYKGADIDTIAIVADLEKAGKRSHRYRVVMVKVRKQKEDGAGFWKRALSWTLTFFKIRVIQVWRCVLVVRWVKKFSRL